MPIASEFYGTETKTDSDSFQTGLTTVDIVFKNETFIYL